MRRAILNRSPKASRLPPAQDRVDARQRLLEAAGHIFADKGFDRATGKEIAESAGTNTAAVNYYFGGMEGLYAAVLDEAHHRLITLETLSAALAGKTDPKAKLEAILSLGVKMILGPVSKSWVLRVIGREVVAPSETFAASPEAAVQNAERLVRMGILKGIVAELMGLPLEHPAVARGCISLIAPIAMLMIVDRQALTHTFPGLSLAEKDAGALTRHLVDYAVAGLATVGARQRG